MAGDRSLPPHPAQPAGAGPRAAHRTVENLAWAELADAVWLTLATQQAWQRHTGTALQPETDEPAPDAKDIPDGPDTPVRAGFDAAAGDAEPADQVAEAAAPRGWANGSAESPGEQGGAGRDDVTGVPLTQRPADEGAHPLSGAGNRLHRLTRMMIRPSSVSPEMVRALRPFKRRVPSWREDEVILDEEATAERAAQDGLWLPVTAPERVRWLDLTLVVDSSPSMALWQPTIRAFTTLLEQLGAFRTIQRRLIDTRRAPVLQGATPGTPDRSPVELLDTSGRRVVLVLTDAVGAAWRQRLLSPVLAHWASVMPVALIHLLPQRLWGRSGLDLRHATVTPPHSLAPNRHWRVDLPDAWLDDDGSAASGGAIAVPVLELQPRWLSRWAQLVTGNRKQPADAVVLLAGEQARPGDDDFDDDDDEEAASGAVPSARDRVLDFLSRASPMSYRLATLLAAVPVSLPVARTVQAEMVPESGLDHLAEVFNSGLLRPQEAAGSSSWHTATFDFPDAVREMLLSGARRTETARVVGVVADRFADRITGIRTFRQAIAAPDTSPDPAPDPGTERHTAIERAVMRALSGPYLPRASRLGQLNRSIPTVSGEQPDDDAGLSGANRSIRSRINTVSHRMSEANQVMDPSTEPARPAGPAEHRPAVQPGPSVQAGGAGTGRATGQGAQQDSGSDVVPFVVRERQVEDVPPVWGDVPPRNPIFTGREELLDQLGRRLIAGGTTAILPAALHGMGGIGKTQIATEYIYRHLTDYDLVWWVQATQAAQIRASFADLARALRLPGSAEANTAVPQVREALRVGQPYRRWLLVFDSAESPEAVRPFFPPNGPGEILITSRNPDWAGVARPLEIAVFEREESVELLRRRGPEIDNQQAEALAEKLGDLPLAIAQAAAWRAETGMPVSEYLRLFDEKVAEILDASRPNDYEVSLAAAWNVSFDELQTRNPAAHQFLQVCAFFAPEPISRGIFSGVRGVSVAPELDAALRDPIRLSRAIRDINRYGLAKIDHRNDTLVLHRLVQLVLRDRMPPQRATEMRHAAHLLLANQDPNNPVASSSWPQYQAILPHAYASDIVECDDAWVRQLALNLMAFLFRWGDHDEAVQLARRAYQLWKERLGETDAQTLDAAGLLGLYLWAIGKYPEASELNQRTLELRLQVSGENSEETLNAQSNVLTDLRATGEWVDARRLSLEIYEKARGLFGEDDPVTLAAAHRHGLSLRHMGDYHAALELDEKTYQRRVEVLGYDHADTLSTYTAIVLDRREAGEYAWARQEDEKLAESAFEQEGEDGALTVRRHAYLAVSRRKDGDHPGALELSGPALQRLLLRHGPDHPVSMACALAHSMDLRHAGELRESRKRGEEIFDRFRRNFGERHPFTLSGAVDLAVTLRLLGDTTAARQLDERSLEEFRTVLGPDHPYSIVCAIDLANDLAALGEPEAALTMGSDALERARRVLGDNHPTTLAAIANRALDLRAVGRTQEAETAYADVVNRYRRVYGETHPGTIAAAGGARSDCDIDTLPI